MSIRFPFESAVLSKRKNVVTWNNLINSLRYSMVRTTDIHSLTEFTRNAKKYIQQVRDTKNPIAITVNGDAQVVVQDAAVYQEMVDAFQHGQFIAAMRESEAAVKDGRVEDLDSAFAEIREDLGL
jgi:prevent-host-death family protein